MNPICGVDVSSAMLDARLGRDGPVGRFANEAAGVAELAAFCKQHQVRLVALEATGGYERLAFAVLWSAGIPTAIVNPRAVRRFAEAMGFLEKTDRIDSGIIAWFAEVKRVADRTVARLMAELPEIGTLSNKAAAKLAGLAPIARDSGKLIGNRAVRGGRTAIRSILFVVAELVRRHNPDFTAFHKRLSDAGKPKKVIRIALAHKLLVRLNAKARDVRAQIACPA